MYIVRGYYIRKKGLSIKKKKKKEAITCYRIIWFKVYSN